MNDNLKKEAVPSTSSDSALLGLFNISGDHTRNSMVMVWDNNEQLHYISEEGREFLELEIADYEAKDLKWTLFFNESMVQSVQEHFYTKKIPFHLTNLICVSSQKQKKTCDVKIAPFILGEHTYFIGHFTDMTPIVNLQNYFVEQEKLITASRLSAGLVHEIRNPLTSLKGFLQLLQAGITQKEEYYRVMIQEVEKLEEITTDLLVMSKPDKKKKQKEPIKKIIDDVVFIMSTQVDLRKVEFDLYIDSGLHAYCKASQIKQVLINIIKNSAEAMKHEGTILIEAFKSENEIHILITDEGEGIEPIHIKEIKTPFYTTKSDGTGLGISVITHILKEHGGDFSLEPNDNSGMTVSIHLPSVE